MKLSDIGEFGLINRFAKQFLKHMPGDITGIGDDCAVLPKGENEVWLVTTDMLIEDSHFLRAKIAPEDLGYKSLAVNLSDIAAMGGNPHSAFLSLGIPPDIEVEWLDRFFAGLAELADKSNTLILGGDTTKSQQALIINIVVIGYQQQHKIKLRSNAVAGDQLYLTGNIGNSATGLRLLLKEKALDSASEFLIKEHNRPSPHLSEGAWLGQHDAVHAMIDVSDGIDSDLKRLMEQSGCGMQVDLAALPISDEMQRTCKRFNWPAEEIAATGGEDYCLLCTIDSAKADNISQEFEKKFLRPLHYIGTVTEEELKLTYIKDQKPVRLTRHGFDHFK